MVQTATKKRYLILLAVLPAMLALTACGGGGEEEPAPLTRPSVAIEDIPDIPDVLVQAA